MIEWNSATPLAGGQHASSVHLSAIFRSSDDDIVAVSSGGFASALKAGEAQITATIGSISGTLTIPVYEWDDACYGCWDY